MIFTVHEIFKYESIDNRIDITARSLMFDKNWNISLLLQIASTLHYFVVTETLGFLED